MLRPAAREGVFTGRIIGEVAGGGKVATARPPPRMHAMPTVAIIPARGGSKGLPGKHLRLLGGEPLIVHTIRASLAARRVDRTVVSTDDPAIRSVALRAGADAPFLRPPELAADDAPTLGVIRHAVEWLEHQGQRVDLVVTLQPTSPLRGAAEIDQAVHLLDDPEVGSAVSVTTLEWPSTVIGRLRDGVFEPLVLPGADVRRQVAPPAARITGAVYVTRRSVLAGGRLLDDRPAACLASGASAIDIDSRADLVAARRAWRRMGGGR